MQGMTLDENRERAVSRTRGERSCRNWCKYRPNYLDLKQPQTLAPPVLWWTSKVIASELSRLLLPIEF